MGKIKIDTWSDIACPHCYIATQNFSKAFEALSADERAFFEITPHSYLLDPERPQQSDLTINQHLQINRGMSSSQIISLANNLNYLGGQVNVKFNFATALVANTFKAHQLIHFAHAKGKAEQAKNLLFKAYFTDGKRIGELETLQLLASEIGLNAQEVEKIYQNKLYEQDVRNDITFAKASGIKTIPYYVFDGKIEVTGEQSVAAFTQLLRECLAENASKIAPPELEVHACSIDGHCF